MSATRRFRGGSAAITITSQRRRLASSTIRFVALRVPTTCPSAETPRFFNSLTASSTIFRCSSHSYFVGSSPGTGSPSPVPQTRAIEKTRTDARYGCASRAASWTAELGIGLPSDASRSRRISIVSGSGGSRWCAASRPTPLRTGVGDGGRRLIPELSLVLHVLPVPVERQVRQEHAPADEVIRKRRVAGERALARRVFDPAVEVDDHVDCGERERD